MIRETGIKEKQLHYCDEKPVEGEANNDLSNGLSV